MHSQSRLGLVGLERGFVAQGGSFTAKGFSMPDSMYPWDDNVTARMGLPLQSFRASSLQHPESSPVSWIQFSNVREVFHCSRFHKIHWLESESHCKIGLDGIKSPDTSSHERRQWCRMPTKMYTSNLGRKPAVLCPLVGPSVSPLEGRRVQHEDEASMGSRSLTVFWPSTTNRSSWKNWLMALCL